MKRFFSVIIVCAFVSFVGCDWIAPNTMKTKIEREQMELLKEEIVALERIAVSLEKIADSVDERKDIGQ